ncbi:MAG: DUF58 domain-containing protein [Gammaproteobacteria bacterium]|nr:DUF58 domain-containing protein [Gammaproteobacteria bacterium]
MGRALLYRAFAPTWRVGRWYERRFTPTGRVFAGTFLVALLFSIDREQSLALALAAFTGTALAVAWLATLRLRPDIEIHRSLPERLTDGTPAHYEVTLHNRGRRWQRGLGFREIPAPSLPDLATFDTFRSADDRLRPWFDRVVGFPRWLEMVRLRQGTTTPAARLPDLPPGASITVRATLTPLRRGRLVIDGCELLAPDPLGLCIGRQRLSMPAASLVLPRRIAVPAIELRAHRQYQRGGVTLARSVGDSSEFIGLRDYRPGDSRRHIQWRAWARLGYPVVREYQDEYYDRHLVVLDGDEAPGGFRQFETMVAAAASLVVRRQPADALLDLVVNLDAPTLLTSGRGIAASAPLLDALASVQPRPDQAGALRRFLAQTVPHIGSVIVVTGQLDGEGAELARSVVRQRVACCLLHVPADGAAGGAGEAPCRVVTLPAESFAAGAPASAAQGAEEVFA